MAEIMTQEHISTNMPNSGPDYMHRNSKQDLQSHQFLEAKINCYKGPAKPPMPKSDSKLQVLPLKVLASTQIHRFHFFMQLIVSGYNTKIAREAGQKLLTLLIELTLHIFP